MQYDLSKIKKELEGLPEYDAQIYLQGKEKGIDPIEPVRGRMWKEIDKEELEWDKCLWNFPYINGILEHMNLCRARVMKAKPKSCYLWHCDIRKRFHIPIKTNEHCFLLLENEGRIHLPATGKGYVVDTTQMHTVVNASREERIHIVGTFK